MTIISLALLLSITMTVKLLMWVTRAQQHVQTLKVMHVIPLVYFYTCCSIFYNDNNTFQNTSKTSYDSITSWIASPISLRRASIPASLIPEHYHVIDFDTHYYVTDFDTLTFIMSESYLRENLIKTKKSDDWNNNKLLKTGIDSK